MAIVQVPGVYPPGSNVSITGLVVSGDGHVVGGVEGHLFGTPLVTRFAPITVVPGVGSAQQFGVPKVGAQNVPPGGVPSAALFGTVTAKLPGTTKIVGSVPSAAQFGAPHINVIVVVGPVFTAQQFGTVRANYVYTINGVGSAQLFGVFTLYTHVWISGVGGLGSAQLFGRPIAHRYDLHVDCKPEGGLGLPPSSTAALTIGCITEGSFVLTPNSEGVLTLVPDQDDLLALAPIEGDG